MDQDIKLPVSAGESLTGAQYTAIEIDGTVAPSMVTARGILQNKPQNGEGASLLATGRSKFKAGGTIVITSRLTVASSGFIVAVASGDVSCGFTLGAVASGGITEGMFDFVAQRILA